MSTRFEKKAPTTAQETCEICWRADTDDLLTTGELTEMWLDNDTGETLCARCKEKGTP